MGSQTCWNLDIGHWFIDLEARQISPPINSKLTMWIVDFKTNSCQLHRILPMSQVRLILCFIFASLSFEWGYHSALKFVPIWLILWRFSELMRCYPQFFIPVLIRHLTSWHLWAKQLLISLHNTDERMEYEPREKHDPNPKAITWSAPSNEDRKLVR
jgi:hypothetical protein